MHDTEGTCLSVVNVSVGTFDRPRFVPPMHTCCAVNKDNKWVVFATIHSSDGSSIRTQ